MTKSLILFCLITVIFQNKETIKERFIVPNGYKRVDASPNSFENHLQNLTLKPKNSLVKYYNGTIKPNNNIYEAVVNLPIGKKDLHQCADAIMRLRADYFYQKKAFDQIHFNFTNGFRVDYINWRNGERIDLNGNKTYWIKKAEASDNQLNYWGYLETVFMYAGTASLAKEMRPTSKNQIKIGDVFIKGGFPGHAVIIVDIAVNPKSGKKAFLLAQSYMPAQEIQILKNPNESNLSPWYSVDYSNELVTPEWTFKANELMKF